MDGQTIQAKIWRGYALAAIRIGVEYKFYRLRGTTKRQKYDTGLKYNHHLKYGPSDTKVYDRKAKYDQGLVADQGLTDAEIPTKLDTPGARFDQGNAFDETDPRQQDQTVFDEGTTNFDSGFLDWDQPGNLIGSWYVSLNAEDMKYGRPNKYGKPTWYALVDGTDLQVGDYFIGPQGTFFIAAMQPLLPILVVECNRTINIYRPQTLTGIGAQDYGGTTDANLTLLAGNRPCSILQGTKGEKSEANLPGDVRAAWYAILLPESGIVIDPDDIIEDDLGRRYAVSSTELSDLGWRLSAMIALP